MAPKQAFRGLQGCIGSLAQVVAHGRGDAQV